MSRYVLKGTKNKGERVGKIKLDDERILVLDGQAVEMTDEEHDNLVSQGYTLHKRRDRTSGSQDDNDNEDDTPEKGGDN